MKRLHNSKSQMKVQNTRAVNPTVQSIPFYGELQKKKVLNTLEAGQHTAVFFLYRRGGVPCTCSGSNSLLDSNGDMSDSTLAAITSDKFDPIDKLVPESKGNVRQFVVSDLDMDEFLDDEDDDFEPSEEIDTSDFFDDIDANFLEYGAVSCACCYSSGYVGGFDLHNGFRLVVATPSSKGLQGYEISNSSSPYHFHCTSDQDGYVTFEETVPNGCQYAKHRLMNNKHLVPFAEYVVEVNLNGVWTEVSTLQTLAIGKPIQFRVKSNVDFTHLEINYLFSRKLVYIDMPQFLPSDFSKQLMGEDSKETQINVGADVPLLPKWSILYDSKYKRKWQVREITPVMDIHHTITSYEITVRMIHEQEIINDIFV